MSMVRIVIALFLLTLLAPLPLWGQIKIQSGTSGPVDITGRELRYNKRDNIYTAQGDVELKEGDRLLTADFVLYNDTTKDAFAEGHVIFQDLEDVIHAERMSFNTVTKRGTIEKGTVYVKKGNFYMTGNEIEKTGEYTYFLRQGEFTTCGLDHPDWTFKAKDVNLSVGGYATVDNAYFNILGHPVAYLPWGVFPVKTERQSGFLIPTVTSSSFNGRQFEDAYYWAIDKDKDATFYFDWLQNRGEKPGAEYRYTTSETTKGFWYGSIIDDMDYHHTRYQIDGQHQQSFGDINFKADVNHVSDNTYLEDLGATVVDRSQNSLRSVVFAEKPFSGSLLTGEAAYFQDLTQKSNNATEQYLPELSYFTEYYSFLNQRLYGDLSADLTNFEQGSGDRTTRLTATPTARVPYSLNGINFLASAGVTEKSYQTNNPNPGASDTVHHEAATIEGDANAQFLKNTSTSLFNLGQVQSVISPHVTYTYLKNDESFVNVPSIDPADRIFDANVITYSFNHYFNQIKDNQVREVSLLEIEQTYGLSEKLQPQPFLYYGSGSRLSDIHERFTFFPTTNIWYVNENVFSVHGYGFTSMTNGLHYAWSSFFQVDLSHSYGKEFFEPATEQVGKEASNEVSLNTTLKWRQFDLNYQIWYSFVHPTGVVDQTAAVTYHPSCWAVTFTVQRSVRPNNMSYNLSFSLQGITQKVGSPQATSTTTPPFPPAPQGGSSAPQTPVAPGTAPETPQTPPATGNSPVYWQHATISQGGGATRG
jgi:LPS-assembly protein